MPRRRTFQNARCLVTGASSGLGREIARQLVEQGAKVLLTGRSSERLEALSRDLIVEGANPDSLSILPADLTDPTDRERLVEFARQRWGALDLVVNSAGVGATGHFDTHDPSILRKVFEINVFGLIELTRIVLPLLREGDHPTLVNLGSIVARRGIPGRSEYAASKFAVAGFTESIRAEWSKYGIHVILLNPGFTATEFEQNLLVNTARVATAHKRVMSPQRVATKTLRAIQEGRHEMTLTTEGRFLLFVNRLWPRLVDRGFARFTRRVFQDVVATSRNVPTPKFASRLHQRPRASKIERTTSSGD